MEGTRLVFMAQLVQGNIFSETCLCISGTPCHKADPHSHEYVVLATWVEEGRTDVIAVDANGEQVSISRRNGAAVSIRV